MFDASVPAERAAWVRLWESSPMRLPFAHPAFSEPMLEPGDRLVAAVWDGGDPASAPASDPATDPAATDPSARTADPATATPHAHTGSVLHALIVRRLPGNSTDLISPYGYAGPLVWDADDVPALAHSFWAAFAQWAARMRAVSEFVRFPLVDEVLPFPGTTTPRLVNYVAALPDSAEDLWASYAPKVRQNTRRALRSGVTVEFDTTGERLEQFLALYHSTMVRHESDAWYRFDASCFERLHRELPGGFVYVYAMHESQPVSVDLVLLGSQTAYYYLGGTDADAFRLRPNELVKTAAIEHARSTGRTHYVLGGGLETGDGLERYKRGFAPEGAQMFCSGERILDDAAYASLTCALDHRVEELRASGRFPDWVDGPGYFPAYRRRFTVPSTSPRAHSSRAEERVR